MAVGGALRNLPEETLELAIQHNPWFTRYYIEHARDQILPWFDRTSLSEFLASYPQPSGNRGIIGIITAGNLPFVGLHDVLMGVLSGNQVRVKLSRQDSVLMNWFIQTWQDILPELRTQLQVVEAFPSLDYLLATGSDNSARYFQAIQPGVNAIIRKNRFSVARVSPNTSSEEFHALGDDIFLYNGLGCRNVSNLFIEDGTNLTLLQKSLTAYPKQKLNPLYLKKVKQERARLNLKGAAFRDWDSILAISNTGLSNMPMGCLNLIMEKDSIDFNGLVQQNAHRIQCAVGLVEAIGSSQAPRLQDFADGVDTLQKLLTDWKHT